SQFKAARPLRRGAGLCLWRGKKEPRVATGLAVGPANLLHAELFTVEVEAFIDIGDTNHGVEIAERHGGSLLNVGVWVVSLRCTRAWCKRERSADATLKAWGASAWPGELSYFRHCLD